MPGEPDVVFVTDFAVERERRVLLHHGDKTFPNADPEPCLCTEIDYILHLALKEIGPWRQIFRLFKRDRKFFRTDAQMSVFALLHLFVVEDFQRRESVDFQDAVVAVYVADCPLEEIGVSDECGDETVFRRFVNFGSAFPPVPRRPGA